MCQYQDFSQFLAVPVELRQFPTNTTVNETDLVELACEAFGLPQPSFIWSTPTNTNLNDRAQVDPNLSIRFNISRSGSTGGYTVQSILRFESIKDTDGGKYICTTSNEPKATLNSTDTASFNIVVQSKHNKNFIVFRSHNNCCCLFQLNQL